MSTKFVRNAVVKPNFWAVENFFETRDGDFVAAVQTYTTDVGSYTVVFKDRKAFFLLDSETFTPASRDEVASMLKQLYKEGQLEEDFSYLFEDYYAEIGNRGYITNTEILDKYGFSEDQRGDIIERMKDLDNYWVDEVIDM